MENTLESMTIFVQVRVGTYTPSWYCRCPSYSQEVNVASGCPSTYRGHPTVDHRPIDSAHSDGTHSSKITSTVYARNPGYRCSRVVLGLHCIKEETFFSTEVPKIPFFMNKGLIISGVLELATHVSMIPETQCRCSTASRWTEHLSHADDTLPE